MGRQRYYRRRYRNPDIGREMALKHIEEAQQFSNEIGGTDKDVKQYFFSLTGAALDSILTEYGRIYGRDAEDYARKTLAKWQSGKTHMSGLVAKRLFSLLPPRMPLATKFNLAENVWKHFGPSSSHSYTIGPDADVEELARLVAGKLDEQVIRYAVPEHVQNRFTWLAAGDVRLKEQLLNHFRQLQKKLAVQKLRHEIPVLQERFRADADTIGHTKTILQVHRHEIAVWIDKTIESQIAEGRPRFRASEGGSGYAWWIIGALILLALYLF